jgi:hypothetical protein
MYVIPGTPFIALSMGVTTALAHTSALAPVYLVVTVTAGGAISGYCVTGNWVSDNKPINKIITDTTIDNTGL